MTMSAQMGKMRAEGRRVYLDNAATTCVSNTAFEAM